MGLLNKFNRLAKAETETGLSTNSNYNGGRFFNTNGVPNMQVRGMSFLGRLNLYHSMLSMKSWKFLTIIILFFIIINLVFTAVYLVIGVNHLGGMVVTTNADRMGEAFFFSAQTFTTVGYGRVNPIGFTTSAVAAFEALTGLMSFALVTGLLYGRFARPKAFIRYSKNALFTPFKDGVAFMFRIVPYTKNLLVNVEAKATLAVRIEENGVIKNKFYNLPFEIAKANTLTANWTIVHMINEESPFYGLSKEDIANANAEVLVFIQGFDETFANTVISRSSYNFTEFVYGAKFSPMFHPTPDGRSTLLHLDKLDDYELVLLNNMPPIK